MDDTGILPRLHDLLTSSLLLWAAEPETSVALEAEAVLVHLAAGGTVRIAPAAPALRHVVRWSVRRPDGTQRNCGSILGVLETVRDALGTMTDEAAPLRIGFTGMAP